MVSKWIIYILTFLSYATFHSIRSAWAALKNLLYALPFDYSQQYLGVIDMMVVLSLALTLTVFGHHVEKIGPKRCLIAGMITLAILTSIIAILLILQVTSTVVYLILFGIGVGVVSATGWPSCLYLLSQHFDKKNNTALPIWNGTSQFGDFIALFVMDIIIEFIDSNQAISLLIIPGIMFIIVILNIVYLPPDEKQIRIIQSKKDVLQLNQQNQINSEENQQKNSNIININMIKINNNQNYQIQDKIINKKNNEQVNYLQNQPTNFSPTKSTPILQNYNIDKMIKSEILVQQKQRTQPNLNYKTIKSHRNYQQNELADNNHNNHHINKNNNNNIRISIKQIPHQNQKNLTSSTSPSCGSKTIIYTDERPVTFLNVWLLPGVALYALSSGVIKSINVLIMTWLVFYLSTDDIDMKDQSRIIAILWACGVFGGGIIGGIINKNYSKFIFIISLIIAGIMFFTLENMHEKIYKTQMIIAIVLCSLAYGGPYSMLGTAVPIMLGEKQGIKNRVGAKSAVISLMEGFPLFVCAFSILIVPLIGIKYLHFVLMGYCAVACIILSAAIFMDRIENIKKVPSQSNSEREQQDKVISC